MTIPRYVPFLKLKRGEKRALRELSAADAARITPLFEVVERKGPPGEPVKPLPAHLRTAFEKLAEAVARCPRFFLDTWEIADDGEEGAQSAFATAAKQKLAFVPVTGLSRSHDVQAAVDAGKKRGIALRVTRSDFEKGVLRRRLVDFCHQHELRPSKVDLILDLGSVADMLSEGVGRLGLAFLRAVPNLSSWRTVTVHSTAFPQSMGKVKSQESAFVERADFSGWRDHIFGARSKLARLPDFSDMAIQHPQGVENFDPKVMQGSAAIRYAVEADWLLVKGSGTRGTRPTLQFPDLARRLTATEHPNSFMGTGHCAGCNMIHAAAEGAAKLGSLETWRTIGTVHHITLTLAQLDALAGASTET